MSKQIQKQIEQFFNVQQLLGSGAYGHVWKVTQKGSKKALALKKIFDAFQNDIDSQRTYRQITMLHQLSHPNIIKLQGVLKSNNKKDLYLLFEHMQTDLHSLVGQNVLEMPHLTFIIYQICKALKYVHSAQLIHRDLKPSNILINSDCQIKLCDFGLVRSLTRQQHHQLVLSQDVATRWYRSPEILLGSQSYGPQTDVWSVGCILAELLIGEPIMMGASNIEQFQKILELTGLPSKSDITSMNNPTIQGLIRQFNVHRKPFKNYFKGSKYEMQFQLIELIHKMLQFNPNKRITIDQILTHDLIFEIRSLKEQTLCQKVVIPELDDNKRFTVDDYRDAIYKDIQRRYPKYNPVKQQNTRIFRSHNSLVNRANSIISLEHRKNYGGSIFRTKNSQILKNQKQIRSLMRNTLTNQSQSLHQNPNTVSKNPSIPQKYAPNSSVYYSSGIQETKDNSDASRNNQLSPFKKYKKMTKQMKDKTLEKILGIEGLVKKHQKQNSAHNQYDPSSIYQPKMEQRVGQHYLANNIKRYSPAKNLQHSPTKNGKYANRITRKAFNRDKKQAIHKARQSFVYIENRKDL